MGVLTTFYLIEPDHFRESIAPDGYRLVRTSPLAWILRYSGRLPPERFGLPTDYETTSHCIDKSWESWPTSLNEENFEIYEIASTGIPIHNALGLDAWYVAARNGSVIDSDDGRTRLLAATARFLESHGEERPQDHPDAYVQSHVWAFSAWLQHEWKPEEVLIAATA